MGHGFLHALTRIEPPTDIGAVRSVVERRLAALAPGRHRVDPLNAAIRYALLAPGKRIRPLLTILSAWEFGLDGLSAMDAGCAIEMVHAASLILDDLPSMDDAKYRRGQPATHVAFGQDVAILAAIGLLGRAFTTLSSAVQFDPTTRIRLVAILAQALGSDGLAGGQYEDLRAPDRARSVDTILDTNHLKTGILFVAAAEMAGVVAGASEDEIDRLRSFATHLGQAFQLWDDLSDGDAADETGAPGEDAGRVTALSLLGPEEVRRRLDGHVAEGLSGLRPDGQLAIYVRSVFQDRARPPALVDLQRVQA